MVLEEWLSNFLRAILLTGTSSSSWECCFLGTNRSLGPVLFLININDLPNCCDVLKFRIFGDDTNVFANARDLKSLEQLMNSELTKIKVWCNINKLSINFFSWLIVKSRQKRDFEVNIKIENENGTFTFLERKDRIKYLGVLVDETVSFRHHISYICLY